MPSFTEADIRAGANSQSFSRGMSYYRDGAVIELARRGAVITAEVEGSDYAPYAVTVNLDATGGIAGADCSCPYDYDGYCKHIVAVLLAVLHDDNIKEHADLESLLQGLTETQLRQLILTLGGEQASFADAIEREVNLLRRTTPDAPTLPAALRLPPSIDVAAICRDLGREFRRATSTDRGGRRGYLYDEYDEWDIDAGALLAPATDAAAALLTGGDPAGAAALLAGVIEEWSECITDLEEWVYEGNEEAFAEASEAVDALLAECLLSLPLTDIERKTWRARLDDWADDTISLAISDVALETWWDHPPLIAAMQGNITEQGAWADTPSDCAARLAQVRLRILERQGRSQEYLNLAQAEGELLLYLTKLIELGEIERTIAEANAYLAVPAEVLAIAQRLHAKGHRREALQVAASGLDLSYPHALGELARWLAPRAQAQGDEALALRAAKIAFGKSYHLEDYQAAERIAGAAWNTVKGELLDDLQRSSAYTAVDIYLVEHMLVEAMQAVDKRGDYSPDLERVIDVVRGEYPDWCIKHCKRRAEHIMNDGDAKRYQDAAEWLRRAHAIYAQHNRLDEWRAYMAGLLDTHGRKYKLVPLLKAIH